MHYNNMTVHLSIHLYKYECVLVTICVLVVVHSVQPRVQCGDHVWRGECGGLTSGQDSRTHPEPGPALVSVWSSGHTGTGQCV